MDGEEKSGMHVNIGGLIILVVIVVILFKVDIKEKIQSKQFQDNIAYLENSAKGFFNEYIITPLKSKAGDVFMNATNDATKKLQDNLMENLPVTNSSGDNINNTTVNHKNGSSVNNSRGVN